MSLTDAEAYSRLLLPAFADPLAGKAFRQDTIRARPRSAREGRKVRRDPPTHFGPFSSETADTSLSSGLGRVLTQARPHVSRRPEELGSEPGGSIRESGRIPGTLQGHTPGSPPRAVRTRSITTSFRRETSRDPERQHLPRPERVPLARD